MTALAATGLGPAVLFCTCYGHDHCLRQWVDPRATQFKRLRSHCAEWIFAEQTPMHSVSYAASLPVPSCDNICLHRRIGGIARECGSHSALIECADRPAAIIATNTCTRALSTGDYKSGRRTPRNRFIICLPRMIEPCFFMIS